MGRDGGLQFGCRPPVDRVQLDGAAGAVLRCRLARTAVNRLSQPLQLIDFRSAQVAVMRQALVAGLVQTADGWDAVFDLRVAGVDPVALHMERRRGVQAVDLGYAIERALQTATDQQDAGQNR